MTQVYGANNDNALAANEVDVCYDYDVQPTWSVRRARRLMMKAKFKTHELF